LLVTPQLWMLKPGVAQRIRQFVEAGGTWVATHLTGYVQENNLMLLGGLPGDGLQEVLGIWNEESDSLPAGKLRRLRAVPGSDLPSECAGHDICELLHLRGARAVAEYAEEFYAGMAAVTANAFGKGHAYYLGTKLDVTSLEHFYAGLLERLGITGALGSSRPLPPGVTVQRRETAEAEFLFILCFTAEETRLALPPGRYRDPFTDRELSGEIRLEPWSSTVLARHSTTNH
jgi:beta-galactosidase